MEDPQGNSRFAELWVKSANLSLPIVYFPSKANWKVQTSAAISML